MKVGSRKQIMMLACGRKNGSVTDTESATLPRVRRVCIWCRRILPGVSYESAPGKFREARSTTAYEKQRLKESLPCAVQYRTDTPWLGFPLAALVRLAFTPVFPLGAPPAISTGASRFLRTIRTSLRHLLPRLNPILFFSFQPPISAAARPILCSAVAGLFLKLRMQSFVGGTAFLIIHVNSVGSAILAKRRVEITFQFVCAA